MNNKTLLGALIAIVALALGGYSLWSASRTTQPTPVSDQNGQTSIPSETTNPGSTGNASEDNGIGDSSSPSDNEPEGTYKDGTYTGSLGSAAPFGEVQVKVTIAGGKITKIDVVKKPEGPGTTNEIAAWSYPPLIREALAIQSADVHIVSGATQNAEGFQVSLASALAQAQR